MFEQDFLVEYVDIDIGGHLSNHGFFKYLQEISCLHASKLGFGLDNADQTGFAWILLDWKLKIFSRPTWNTLLHIKTWPSKIDHISCFRDYEITDSNGNRIAIATSKWVLFNIKTNHISKIVPEVASAFSPIDSRVFDTEIEKLKEPDSYESSFQYTILRKDIDTNHHVNNLNYIHFALEALPSEVYNAIDFSSIEVMYKKQCLLGDTISCFYHKENESEHIVSIKSSDGNVLHAIVRLRREKLK